MHNHGRSQGQIFAEANTLITCPVGYVLNVVYGDLTSCSYLIQPGSISGHCHTG